MTSELTVTKNRLLNKPWASIKVRGYYKGYIPGLADNGIFTSKSSCHNFINWAYSNDTVSKYNAVVLNNVEVLLAKHYPDTPPRIH